ncbi:MAG: 1-deoxy-D-xylulose-5-phosphate synthase [Acidobacteria bacterium]|nr:1-deoxy-D-xylulose-5-phosphate synthase [Acidobacteriota bacterium]NIM61306.1 1-deoxy-D-xylulose-5-phosphate synthase [Acidobacteriota bacterium]NIO58774.1 1-deoxy-D-xylulose-5-phosphate synthase [Acidobacteriota bacterium]NIQ29817.1 1-deoxy-D-xylulose-5-phosphate synthase [Acidobacteriota bacterium]NIQ84540.1 1-deoxy-D-xylulose-5-phosphate synthase [Acidobacteriota bacterium]
MSEYRFLPHITRPADIRPFTIEELQELAQEMRHAICGQVSKTGGHLAPNLGVVELTIALHYVFDFSHDRLLFDVGHQCYPHKLLTGRFDKLDRLRQSDGMAGFPEPRESPYDLFSVGHAGTGVSTAVGMARGDQLNGQTDRKVVALVGDSSIVNGLAMEGLNNAGTLKRQFLVVLNDNGMSIGPPQGAVSGYFDKFRISERYGDLKQRAHEVLKKLPVGQYVEELYHRFGEMTKAALAHQHLFEHFGLLCIGPIDGHDLPTLIEMLEEVKKIDHPVLLHVKTVKGKGFDFSSDDPTTFHSPKPFTVEGCRVELKSGGRSFTTAYADAMAEIMKRDDKVIAVTAGMPDGTGLAQLIEEFPERAFDVGIAEEHAVDMCAGMAKTGLKPFVTIYSTFLQRAVDQTFQDVALQGLPVRFCMDRAGLVGGDGAVHHGFMDIAMLRSLPGMTLMAAMDEANLKAALKFMHAHDAGPSAVRYPRDEVPDAAPAKEVAPFELGRANLLAEGSDAAILAYGFPANHALVAREQLEARGYKIAVYDARFAKPIDVELIKGLIASGVPILTVEDHMAMGGFGTCLIEACNEHGLPTQSVHRLGLPDRWIYQGGRAEQQREAGIDADGIVRKLTSVLEAPALPAAAPMDDRSRAAAPLRRKLGV